MVDVLNRNTSIACELVDRVADRIDAKLEHATAVHGKYALAVRGSFERRGAGQPRYAQRLDIGCGRKLNGKGVLSSGLNDRSARAVTKEHARRTVGPVECTRHLLGSDDKYMLGTATGDIALGDIKRKYKAGTGRRDVEGRTCGPQALGNSARFGGNEMVARRRRADDKIQLARVDSGCLECLLACCNGKVVERLVGADMAALNTRAGKNPLIRGIEKLGQLVIGNAALGKCRARSQYRETHH